MKKLMFIFAAAIICIGCASSRTSKNEKVAEHPLVGMWQYCQPIATEVEGVVKYTHRPIYKIINNDNTYFVSAGSMKPVEGTSMQEVRAIITQRGRYEIVNDNTYNELIDIHNRKQFIGTKSIMTYKFEDENMEYLHVDFVNNETGVAVSEVWRRVVFVNNFK